MAIDIKVPSVGESVHEVQVGQWLKQEGEWAAKDENLVELETDKATLDLPAPASGIVVKILKQAGEACEVGDVIGQFEPSAKPDGAGQSPTSSEVTTTSPQLATEPPAQSQAVAPPPNATNTPAATWVTPSARRALAHYQLNAEEVPTSEPGGRLREEDVERYAKQRGLDGASDSSTIAKPTAILPAAAPATRGDRQEEVVPMSLLRRRIAQRLVEAQQQAALLTTFNEVDMTAVVELRTRHRDTFHERHGVKLGFMSFFVKASIEALKRCPQINAEIRGNDIVYRNYYDIGVAVSSERGLVVPVVRNAERMSFAEIEKSIGDFSQRAARKKLAPEELEGGTFTISNGGVFGSLLSTPIVNPPQSGVLGLHAIQDRPVARNGEVVIRPMMYLALTYDHRIVDGREAVGCLRHIKELIEEPSRMLLEI